MKRYIGNDVYVDYDGFQLILTTEKGNFKYSNPDNGDLGCGSKNEITNAIYIAPRVFNNLIAYITEVSKDKRNDFNKSNN